MRVVEAIDLLCDTPAAGSALKGEFEGLRRLRVGHYRVVYEWQRSELVILPGGAHRPPTHSWIGHHSTAPMGTPPLR